MLTAGYFVMTPLHTSTRAAYGVLSLALIRFSLGLMNKIRLSHGHEFDGSDKAGNDLVPDRPREVCPIDAWDRFFT